MVNEQISLLYVPRDLPSRSIEEGWDYATADTKTHTHGFHAYPAVMIPLAHLREAIFAMPDQAVRQFMLVVFSHTVRQCSYTRKGEFKLYRLPESQIRDFRARRARQVKAFFDDFAQCFVEITCVCRPRAKACFVVGNRTVRGIRVPTNVILCEVAEGFGWRFVEQFERRIPNKRMPLQNSPSNAPGERGETITRERVAVLGRVV